MTQTLKAIIERSASEANQNRHLYFYSRNQDIPLFEQGVWQIERGFVQLSTINANGEDVLLGWARSSTFFGAWLTPLHIYNAKALSDVSLRWYSIHDIQNSVHLSQEMLPQLISRMRQTDILLTIAGQRRIEDRLQRLLLLLKQEVGQPVFGGTRLSIRLTHQHIASAIGTTRVTITRLISKFLQEELISIDPKRHIILKDGTFADIADW